MNVRLLLLYSIILFSVKAGAQNVAINNDASAPDNSALLDVKSTTKGLLIPRMLLSERNLISNPATGLLIYQTDNGQGLYINNGTPASPTWTMVGPAISGTSNYVVKFNGSNTGSNSLIYDNGTNIGIGLTLPTYPLHIINGSAANTAYITNSGAANNAIYGINSAASGASTGSGVVGITGQTNAASGVKGQGTATQGTGVIGAGNNQTGVTLAAGSGGAFTGTGVGAFGFANTGASGTGVVGVGNNGSSSTLVAGSGGAFSGLTTGVYAKNTSSGASEAIYSDNFGNIVLVNYWNGTTQYKISGTGTVSTNVMGLNNDRVTLHAPETPEIYFQDYGEGQLVNGRAHITIDPVFAKNIVVNDKHPLRVFVQLEGDCKGVYVTSKNSLGFDVVELNGGSSNVRFQWNITCNRADEDMGNGRISQNADTRFEPAPKPLLLKKEEILPSAKENQ
jgi:hypothetical protein